MRTSRHGALAILNVIGLMVLTARGDEQPVELKDLPVMVRQSAEKAVAGAKWSEAVREAEKDGTTYRLKGTDTKGCKVEVTLSAEGKVEAVETVSSLRDLKELPVEVRKAAESAAPGANWAEVVIRTEEEATIYRLKGTDAKGLTVEATLRAEVHIEVVETALDLKELPRPLADALRSLAGAKWTKATMKTGEAETTYEATGTNAKGQELTVTVTDGDRSTVRTELEVFDVPSVVIDAIKAGRPKFRPSSVALVDAQGSVAYVFDGKEDGEEITLSVSLDGKTITVVHDNDDED
jgi:uncharacterized lipoprotein NlpE involved in copper resistance